MGEFRDYRLTIPFGVLALTAFLVVWFDEAGRVWIQSTLASTADTHTATLIGGVLSAIVGSLAVGYVLSTFVAIGFSVVVHARRSYTEDVALALGRTPPSSYAERQALIADADTLLHAAVPAELSGYLRRRLTLVYTACSSVLAMVLGAAVASACLQAHFGAHTFPAYRWGLVIEFGVALVLCCHAVVAHCEYWNVMLVWLDANRRGCSEPASVRDLVARTRPRRLADPTSDWILELVVIGIVLYIGAGIALAHAPGPFAFVIVGLAAGYASLWFLGYCRTHSRLLAWGEMRAPR